ncbi:DUF5819 family protein [Streptomyces calidiresistens]
MSTPSPQQPEAPGRAGDPSPPGEAIDTPGRAPGEPLDPAHLPLDPEPPSAASTGPGRLSWPARVVVALAVGLIASFAAWHLLAIFLFVAPSNTVTNEYGDTIRGYVNPEFEQNWKLFAPNPLQRNVAVEARIETVAEDGSLEVGEWVDLSAMDFEHIRHNLLPSHTAQNELRRAWDFYTNNHDDAGNAQGSRAHLASTYVHRIALLRLSEETDVTEARRVQVRGVLTRVPAPPWSAENIDTSPSYTELDWRTVLPEDLPGGALAPEESS